MYGWRGKVGFIAPPTDCIYYSEFAKVLPKGVDMTVATLGVDKFTPTDFQKAFDMYPAAIRNLAQKNCDIIHAGGGVAFLVVGYERSMKMLEEVKNSIKTPLITDFDAHFGALRALKAKKIALVTPFIPERTEERKKAFEAAGFEVVSTGSLGMKGNLDLENLPEYASYQIAKETFKKAPQAEAVHIACPVWQTVGIIDQLEHDIGVPVVSHVTGCAWAWLDALKIHEPVKGYGKVLEML
jgi:maleate cis-trans isomerase